MINVYITDISNGVFCDKDGENFSEERKRYVASIKNEERKKQSFFAWALLEYAYSDLFGKKAGKAAMNSDGSWRILDYKGYFSIAHSKNLVCVAFSEQELGVDIETFSDKALKLAKRYNGLDKNLTEKERIKEYLRRFTKEECDYKSKNAAKYYYTDCILDKEKNEYFFSLGAKSKEKVCIKTVIDSVDKDKNIITIGELK